jgi:hypothetical protein
MAYLSNFLLSEVFTEAWRWMLGIQALPSSFHRNGIYSFQKVHDGWYW